MKVVLKRSILILFLTGNIIGLSYAQAAELEPVKLKKSCIKKNPLAEGQNDPELLNIFKQVCDSDNTTQKNDLLAKAAMRFYQTNQPVKALNLASQLQSQNIRGSLITDVLFLSGVSIANNSLQQMRTQEMRYLSNDVTYPPAKQLIENIHTAMPAPDPSSFKASSDSSSDDNEKRSYKKQYVTRNKASTSRTSNKRVSSPAKTTTVKPKTAPAATVNKSKSSPFDPLIK
ncbi:hypothetical protein AWW73_00670 [Acinetobacter lactucae]|uniref:hypothetical protein n=1 Tax=Acinetobacter calcoaceticus/baumannii complex TaxID=909768 RepID=UPI0003DF8B3C|nr:MULTISPECIES: hypothetical protein [Acinetobacter calcoaceticus/baumannii complex]ETR95300.1 hypothetical protein M211_1308 [Acinetobacter lactucae]KYQ80750.1 hypothetical protein AWW73_00670 [Acinetobacter lactucae]MCG9483392.1 hypothetical protein [Acinetobacter pittii]QWZ59791.1 hypothetical protein I6L28_14555 [Acinetobacter pittii]QXA09497.1 hypothetical protein I6L27_08160 [Acinetobacter pittii]